jgi:hypothetical protein
MLSISVLNNHYEYQVGMEYTMNTTIKNFAVLLLTIAIASCISVEMPENMVSDVVDAGKELYQSIKEKLADEEDQKAEENIYAALYLADENTTLKDAKARCLEKAIEKAKTKLNRQYITTEVVSEEIKSADQEFVVVCEVKVTD